MTILTIFGLICLVGIAAFVTFTAAAALISEIGFSGRVFLGPVFAAVAIVLWIIVWWVNPFTISVSVI